MKILRILILTLLFTSLIITGCASKTEENSTQNSDNTQTETEKVPTIEMQVKEYSNDSEFCEEIVEIPKISSTNSNSEIDKINSSMDELLNLYKGNYPGYQEEDTWQIISYPFNSDKYLQVVTTAISYPNYGTQGTVYSYNYDIINKKSIALEDAYKMSQTTEETMKSNIKSLFEEKRIDVNTTIEDIEVRGFLIEGDKIEYFSFISMTNPSVGDFKGIFVYEPKENTLSEYNGIALFNPSEMQGFKEELYYMRPEVLEKYNSSKEPLNIDDNINNSSNIDKEYPKEENITPEEETTEETSDKSWVGTYILNDIKLVIERQDENSFYGKFYLDGGYQNAESALIEPDYANSRNGYNEMYYTLNSDGSITVKFDGEVTLYINGEIRFNHKRDLGGTYYKQ